LTQSSTSTATQPPDGVSSRNEGRISKTVAYYAAFIALGLCTASFGPTLPGLAEHTHTRLGEISFLFTARSLGYLIGALLGGRLYDRVRGHPVVAAGLFGMAVLLVAVPVVPLLWLLTGVLLVLGMAEGLMDVGTNTLIVWVHRRNVGPFMNGLHFFFGVGSFLSPIIIAQLVLISGDITWAYWALALLIAPVALAVLRLPSPAAIAEPPHGEAGRTNYRLVGLVVLFFFLYVGGEVGYGGWVYTYTLKTGLADATVAAYLNSTFWGALTLGRLLSVPIAARFSPRAIITADLAGCLVSIAVAVLWPHSLPALWVATFGLGFAMASIFPTTLSLAERRMRMTGNVNGLFFAGSAAGSMLLPWLIGQFFETSGPIVVMQFIMVDIVATAAVFVALIMYSNRMVTLDHVVEG
jgi:MFS transporter, FHS family, Na+ dependent glucose transporter 1